MHTLGHLFILFLSSGHAKLRTIVIFIVVLPLTLFLGVVKERIDELIILFASIVKVSIKGISILKVLNT